MRAVGVEVANESGVAVDEKSLSELAVFVLAELRIHPMAELSLMLVDEPEMEHLHVQWMDLPGPTDVMAFPMDELRVPSGDEEPPEGLLGDVVLCPTIAAQQAREAGHSTDDELHLLCAHGILHLLGYDHAEPDEASEMFRLQNSLLERWRSHRRGGGQA